MAVIERSPLGHQTFFENFQCVSDYFKVPFFKARSMFVQMLPKQQEPIQTIREALIYVERDDSHPMQQTESDLEDIFNETQRGNLLSTSKSFVVRGNCGEDLRMQVLCFETTKPTSHPQGFLSDETRLTFCAKIDSIRAEPFALWHQISSLWGCSRK